MEHMEHNAKSFIKYGHEFYENLSYFIQKIQDILLIGGLFNTTIIIIGTLYEAMRISLCTYICYHFFLLLYLWVNSWTDWAL